MTGSSIIVALNKAGELYLVKQWRYPLSSYTLELPWGGRKPRETYLQAAKRELREEAGLVAQSWKSLGRVADCPGIVNELVSIFLARELKKVGTVTISEESDQSVATIPFSKAFRWVQTGKINDAVSIAALTRAKIFLHL
ncbi:MAG: NUDIX hydrolase [Candidatus Kerfeldbacteria bacterium]|nr:NUDIX hydrolase [Candidatus Kerfeldbacteria bacterium]